MSSPNMPPSQRELRQMLIDAASDAFDVGTFNFDAVVANVLRALVAATTPIPGGTRIIDLFPGGSLNLGPYERDALRHLADSIEKGGEVDG